MTLPWAQCSGVVGYLLAFLGTVLGLLLTSIPGTIGGGIIGLEMATVYSLLGTRVEIGRASCRERVSSPV